MLWGSAMGLGFVGQQHSGSIFLPFPCPFSFPFLSTLISSFLSPSLPPPLPFSPFLIRLFSLPPPSCSCTPRCPHPRAQGMDASTLQGRVPGKGGAQPSLCLSHSPHPFPRCHLSPLASAGAGSPGWSPGLAGLSEGAAAPPAWGGSPRPLPSPRAGRGRPRTNPLAPSAARSQPPANVLPPPRLQPGPAGRGRRTWQRGASVPPATAPPPRGMPPARTSPGLLSAGGGEAAAPAALVAKAQQSRLTPAGPRHSGHGGGRRGPGRYEERGGGVPARRPARLSQDLPGTRGGSGYYIKEVTQAGLFRVYVRATPAWRRRGGQWDGQCRSDRGEGWSL